MANGCYDCFPWSWTRCTKTLGPRKGKTQRTEMLQLTASLVDMANSGM